MDQQFRLAIFASGSGTNAEAIVRYFKSHPRITVALILTNNRDAKVLERAKRYHIPSRVFTRDQFSSEVLVWLKDEGITHIVLAGFLWLIPNAFVMAYPNKIINIHPALLPKFGGKGMYGMKVHEQVRKLNEAKTGITIHLVNEKYDDGTILYQATCDVKLTDTPHQIAENVHQLEHEWYPKVIERWVLEEENSMQL